VLFAVGGLFIAVLTLWWLRDGGLPYLWASLAYAAWNAIWWWSFSQQWSRLVAFNGMAVAVAFALAEVAAAVIAPGNRLSAAPPWKGEAIGSTTLQSQQTPEKDREPDPASLGFVSPINWTYDYTTGYGVEIFLADGKGYKDRERPEFGTISRPHARWFERGTMNGKVVYEQVYQTGHYRERVRPHDDPAAGYQGPVGLALGDSLVFGWGLPWEATMPRRLERRLPDGYSVLNLAHSGWSVADVAAWLAPESDLRPSFVTGQVRFAVLNGISDHLRRVAGLGPWRKWPVYDVREEVLFRAQPLANDASIFEGIDYRSSRVLFRSHLFRTLVMEAWQGTPEQAAIDRYVRLVIYCSRRLKELYDAPMLMVHWDSFFGHDDLVVTRLEAAGVTVLTDRKIFPGGYGPDYQIGVDPHPNARAADLVAAAVARWYETSIQTGTRSRLTEEMWAR
jgi:hypothetical protein